MENITQKILDKLPASWEQLKFRDFIKLNGINITETDNERAAMERMFQIVSILSETSINTLVSLPPIDLTAIVKKIDFISIEPKPKNKGLFQWKKVEEISYNDFITYQSNPVEDLENMPIIIKAFAKDDLTEEQILDMPMTEAVSAFFLLRKDVKKSIRGMIISSKVHLWRLMAKKLFNRVRGSQKLVKQIA